MLFWIDILNYDIGFAYKEGGMLTNYQYVAGKYANHLRIRFSNSIFKFSNSIFKPYHARKKLSTYSDQK